MGFAYFDGLSPDVAVFFISTDPSMLGFLFVGALVLFEKNSNTISALVVTPVRAYQYLGAKALSLTVLALLGSGAMAIASPHESNVGILILAVVLSSVHFVWIGFLGVVRVKTISQYFFVFPFIIAPLMLPLLHFFGIVTGGFSWLFYLFPFQACLLLFKAAFEPILWWQWVYALIYLPLTTALVYYFAHQSYQKHLANT